MLRGTYLLLSDLMIGQFHTISYKEQSPSPGLVNVSLLLLSPENKQMIVAVNFCLTLFHISPI